MTTLSSRERLENVCCAGKGLIVCRFACGVLTHCNLPHGRAWQPLHDLVNEFALDSFFGWGGEFPPSPIEIRQVERETINPEWYEQETNLLHSGRSAHYRLPVQPPW